MSLLQKVKSELGSPDWHVCSKLMWIYRPGHAWVQGNYRADRLAIKKRSQVACFSEDLSAGTKPRTSQHRSPGGERHGKKNRSMTVLESMCDLTVSSWSKPAEGMGDCFHLHFKAGDGDRISCTVFMDDGRTLLDSEAPSSVRHTLELLQKQR